MFIRQEAAISGWHDQFKFRVSETLISRSPAEVDELIFFIEVEVAGSGIRANFGRGGASLRNESAHRALQKGPWLWMQTLEQILGESMVSGTYVEFAFPGFECYDWSWNRIFPKIQERHYVWLGIQRLGIHRKILHEL